MFTDRFKDRHAIITGGAAGIGFCIAERIISEGGHVTIWDRDEDAIAKAVGKLGDSASGSPVDVKDAEAIAEAAGNVNEARGRIDALICSAGITGPNATTWDYPVEAWAEVMEVNLNGIFHCCRAIVPHMMEGGYGRIVNIASIAGKEGNPNAPAYSASKAGVIGLTKSLGKELANAAPNVTVNCVTPAAARTAIFDQMSEEHIAFMLSKVPMGRFALVEEIASLVTWLASEECSFSTGGVFDVSGGRATY